MIKAIIFDFDGVLVESAHIKTEAFRKLFSGWPDNVEDIVRHHNKNAGISRYVKFEYIYKYILKEPYTEEKSLELGREFSGIVLEEVRKAPFVEGAKFFLENASPELLLFIASGTPQDELEDIVKYKKINRFFKRIYGTPATKTNIINNILREYCLNKSQVVFVGDAESDIIAAKNTGVHFVFRIDSSNFELADNSINKIYNLTQLKERIRVIAR
jgi:phosphoglycolate phosphatase-like HAD superfamily hydrolase